MLGFTTDQTPATRLLVIRHGQSLWNQAGRIQGQQDIDLSPLGLRQAETLGERLKDAGLAAVYASPLKRAFQTAEAVAARQGLEVRFDPDLAEIHHGAWEGMTESDVASHYGPLLALWRTRPARVQMPDGEHYYDCKRRSLRAVERIVAAHPGQTVAVVSHDVVVKCVIADVLGLPDDHVTRLHVDNTSISIVEYRGEDALVTRVNDTGHLDSLR
jgi:broad specificity phosphatase PhoE